LVFIVQLPSKNVGASIARPAVLYHKTASPPGDISFFPSENQKIALQFVGGRPMAAPTVRYPTAR
jgi:hypothetical protein